MKPTSVALLEQERIVQLLYGAYLAQRDVGKPQEEIQSAYRRYRKEEKKLDRMRDKYWGREGEE